MSNSSRIFTKLAFGILFIIAGGLIIAACAGRPGGPAPTSVQPTLQAGGKVVMPLANYVFVPTDITIPIGTTVVFQSADPDPHTVTFDNNEYPAIGIEPNGIQEMVFDKEGVYQVFCEYHGSHGLSGMSAIIRVVSASAAVVPTAVTAPTATPRPTLPPLAAGSLSTNGFGLFQDSLGRNDTFNLTVANLPANPAGEYQAWLTGEGAPLNMGSLTLGADGTANLLFFAPGGENLLTSYSGFLVTDEAVGSSPLQPSSTVVFGGVIPPSAIGPTRQLLVSGSGVPTGFGYAVGLVNMAEELLRHARELDSASQSNDIESMNRHIEHMSALIAGKGSPEYRDFEGDNFVDDPGDGFGVLPYANAIAEQALLIQSANVPESLKNSASQLADVALNIQTASNQLLQLRELAFTAQDPAERKAITLQIHALSQQLLNGVDANGDGLIEPIAGEGGAYAAYFQSQYLSAMGVLSQEDLNAVPEIGAATVTPPPTEILPTSTAVIADSTTVEVDVRNFVFVPNNLVIKPGTTLIFTMFDSQHGAYESNPDNTDPIGFDSGVLDPGVQYSITFDEPGVYTIRCTKHKNRMVMTLTVEP
jgi:plastocyanin